MSSADNNPTIAFPVEMDSIQERMKGIRPEAYAQTRNYTNGAVTCLSPYLSRGVISTRQILLHLSQKKYAFEQVESLVMELSWRDYFQRVWQEKNIDVDLIQEQQGVTNTGVSVALMEAKTGIQALDSAVKELYETGYMHNHLRMYIASLACNHLGSHWHAPARWMYFHLLDADWASNACSWQWVAGANSKKKYMANQENINRYTHGNQGGTFLDLPYEALESAVVPTALLSFATPELASMLPHTSEPVIDARKPTAVYTCYNLDPEWMQHAEMNRVLLLEPETLQKYPLGERCISFVLSLANQIPGMQVFTGSFFRLKELSGNTEIHYREHPLSLHFRGKRSEREWMVPEVEGYYPSFFAYRKRMLPYLKKYFN